MRNACWDPQTHKCRVLRQTFDKQTVMLVFVVIHIYMAIRADIMSRESSISTIIGGWRMYKDDLT